MVLRRVSDLGSGPAVCRCLLEQDAERAVDPAGGGTGSGAAHAVGGPPAGRKKWPVGMVRLVHRPSDLADRIQTQDELHDRQSAGVQLRVGVGRRPAGSGGRVSVRTESLHAGHLHLAGDEQTAARSGRRRVHFTMECILAARRAGEDRQHHGCGAWLELWGDGHLPRPPRLHEPLHAAVRGDLRHRIACVQGRDPARRAVHG